MTETLTAAELASSLQRGVIYSEEYLSIEHAESKLHHCPPCQPWALVHSVSGTTLWEWHESNAADRKLALLADIDAVQYALLQKARQHYDERTRLQRAVFRQATPQTVLAALDQHALVYADLYNSADLWRAFEHEAVYGFRPQGYYDRFHVGNCGLELLHYGLFRNDETGEHLVTMRDSRSTGHRCDDILDFKVIEGDERSAEDVIEAARQIWLEHMFHLLRFAPIVQREAVSAMYEAERIYTQWKDGVQQPGPETSDAAHPRRILFTFFPAFRHAYFGKSGFLRALRDIYGPSGNMRYLIASGVTRSCWGGYVSGAEVAAEFNVDASDFIKLFEQMGEADRQDFAAAFEEFIDEDVPRICEGLTDEDDLSSLPGDLAQLAIVLEHGSGALAAPNYLDLWFSTENKMKALVTGDPRWNQFAGAQRQLPLW